MITVKGCYRIQVTGTVKIGHGNVFRGKNPKALKSNTTPLAGINLNVHSDFPG